MKSFSRRAPAHNKRNALENPSVPLSGPAAWSWLSGGHATDAGELVTPLTAMQVSTVYACVKIIAESIASLPLFTYELSDSGRKRAYGHPIYHLLADAPNSEQTAFTFWELMVNWLCLNGNAYVQIQRDGQGDAVALWPLHPLLTTPIRLLDGSIGYRTTDGNAQPRVLASDDVLHFLMTGHADNGLIGASPIQAARQAIGLARAAERYGSNLFRNSSVPAIALTVPQKVGPEIKTKMREDWEKLQSGSNTHRIAILDNGLQVQTLGLSAEDSQFLQTRNYQRADIAAIFRIAPHLVGSTEKMSNSNLENENLTLVTHTLRPWLSRLESEVRRKVLPKPIGKAAYVIEFDTSELTRGDTAAQSAALTAGIQGGWLSPNEARHELNLNPGPTALDCYRVPVNYMNAERLLQTTDDTEPPTLPTDAERNALAGYKTAFLRMFKDGVSRIANRPVDKRDAMALTTVFTPVLESLADMAVDSARSKTGQDALTHDTAKFLATHVAKMAERSCKWTADSTDTVAADEMTRAVKALTFDTFRAASEQLARKELSA